MQIQSPKYNTNITHNQSFGSLTKVFKHRMLYRNAVEDLYKTQMYQSQTIGSLSSDMIDLVKSVAQTKEEKNLLIKKIYAAFGEVARILKEVEERIKESPSTGKWENKIIREESNKKLKQAQELLTSKFRELKLISAKDQIKISDFVNNGGSYGKVFFIDFPLTSKITPKAIKIFRKANRISKLETHGILSETNNAVFIGETQKGKFKNSIFTQTYLTSLEDNFMLSEKAQNYAFDPNKNPHQYGSQFRELSINYRDFHTGNMIGNRIIDYGGFVWVGAPASKDTRKYYSMLIKNFSKVFNCETPEDQFKAQNKFADSIIKLLNGEGKKIKPQEAQKAIARLFEIQEAQYPNSMQHIRNKLAQSGYVIKDNKILRVNY